MPAGCAATDTCTAVAVRVNVDAGAVGFEDGRPPRWYFWPEAWLFRCDIQVDDDAEDGQYYLRLADASFDVMEELAMVFHQEPEDLRGHHGLFGRGLLGHGSEDCTSAGFGKSAAGVAVDL